MYRKAVSIMDASTFSVFFRKEKVRKNVPHLIGLTSYMIHHKGQPSKDIIKELVMPLISLKGTTGGRFLLGSAFR